LSEAAKTWGIFPRCAELGRAVAYFEIAPTLGLEPEASTNLHFIYKSCGFFHTIFYVVTSWSPNKLKIYLQGNKHNEAHAPMLALFVDLRGLVS